MQRETIMKYGQMLLIVLVCVGFDQWTKSLAQNRLAMYDGGWFQHPVLLTVPAEHDGKTAKEFIKAEFGDWNSDAEIADILRGVTTDAAVAISPGKVLKSGDELEVRFRKIVIIDGYFDFEYTRNPGAAFSFLADMDSEYRTPFFVVVGIIALLVILWIIHGAAIRQQLLIVGLSLVAGGAIGNLIDRVRFDYVIDFIVWKFGEGNRWPTFNIADSVICVGVALMVIEMFIDARREKKEKEATK